MFTGKQLNESIRQVCFVLLLAGSLWLIIDNLSYFLSSVLGAFTLYMLLRNPHHWLVSRGWSKTLSSSALLATSIVLIMAVGGGIVSAILPKVMDFKPQLMIDNINSLHDTILQKTGYNIFSKDVVDKAIDSIGNFMPDLFSTTGSIVINGFMSFILLFFMLQGGLKMERTVAENLPLNDDSVALLRHETNNIVVSNAIGIPIIIIGHSIISGLGYWMFGAGDPVAWGMVTGLFGLIPVVGTAGIWLPLAINLLADGNVWQGVVLILYGALIIANVDNLLRIVFMKKYANVHPLVTIFGIILGMNLFGFWGVIFGPLMISGFMLLIKIYHNEFLSDAAQSPQNKK